MASGCVQAEHREDVEQVLVSKALVGLSCIQKMKEELSNTVETQRALASKVGPHTLSAGSSGAAAVACSSSSSSTSCSSPSGGGHEGDGRLVLRPAAAAGRAAPGHVSGGELSDGAAQEAGRGAHTGSGEAPGGEDAHSHMHLKLRQRFYSNKTFVKLKFRVSVVYFLYMQEHVDAVHVSPITRSM